MKIHYFVYLFLLMVVACQAPPPAPRSFTPPDNKRGVHLLLDDGRSTWAVSLWHTHMTAAREVVGEWGFVTQLIQINDLDVTRWQTFMDICAELQLTPIIRLATTYDREQQMWLVPPEDAPQQYANFLAELQWPTDQHYIVVGNEVNHGEEWGGVPNPADYVRFLRETAVLIKEHDPQAILMNAPLDLFTPHTNGQPFPNGMVYMDAQTFMDEMVQADPDIFRYIDAWASHPYSEGPFSASPEVANYRFDRLAGISDNPSPPDGIYNRGLRGYVWELWKLSTYGLDPLPVFITETGWRYGGDYPDPETLTGYWAEAREIWLNDPRVYAVTPFAFNGNPEEWSHTNWLIVSEEGEILGERPFVRSWASP